MYVVITKQNYEAADPQNAFLVAPLRFGDTKHEK